MIFFVGIANYFLQVCVFGDASVLVSFKYKYVGAMGNSNSSILSMGRKRKIASDDPNLANIEDNNTETFTIKCGIGQFLREDCDGSKRLFNKIQQDVCEMSTFAREVSIYIQYYYMSRYVSNAANEFNDLFTTKPKFLQFFYPLKSALKPHLLKIYVLDPHYKELRDQCNLQLYDGSYRAHLFGDLAKYETMIMNNIR